MITFRKATSADIALIQELAEKSWRAAYTEILSAAQIDYMLGTMYSVVELEKQIENPNLSYELILFDHQCAGFMGHELNVESGTAKLHKLYLLEEFKGKKIGVAAMSHLKDEVLAVGNTRLILNVNKNNPALHFYKSHGFTVYAEGVFDIGNGFVMDDFLMECILK